MRIAGRAGWGLGGGSFFWSVPSISVEGGNADPRAAVSAVRCGAVQPRAPPDKVCNVLFGTLGPSHHPLASIDARTCQGPGKSTSGKPTSRWLKPWNVAPANWPDRPKHRARSNKVAGISNKATSFPQLFSDPCPMAERTFTNFSHWQTFFFLQRATLIAVSHRTSPDPRVVAEVPVQDLSHHPIQSSTSSSINDPHQSQRCFRDVCQTPNGSPVGWPGRRTHSTSETYL